MIDNCRIHGVTELVGRVHAIGAKVIFLEPYDPQHMPIEVGFRAMKRCAAPAAAFTFAAAAAAAAAVSTRPAVRAGGAASTAASSLA